MYGNLIVTIMMFIAAVFLCLTLNYAMYKMVWDIVPDWAKRVTFICCVGVIFSLLYLLTSKLWGSA